MLMSQINVKPDDRGDRGSDSRGAQGSDSRGALTEASRNLTWAIGAVIVIAALAFAIVWVMHSLHPV
jgi:hypothetical protein